MTATTAMGTGERRGWKRRAVLSSLAAPLLLTFGLAACGGDDDVTSPTTVTIKPNSYATIPAVAASTTLAEGAPGGTAGADGRVPGTQQYTVRSGDFLSAIASKLGIDDYNDICKVNRWEDCPPSNFFPGLVMTIPPNAFDVATIDEEEPEDTSDDGDEETETTEEETSTGGGGASGPACPDGSDRNTYEIQAGDYPGKVANNLDLTVDQLTTANAGNPAWNAFIEGTEIWLPCDEE